jgi:hypothetical protein
MSLIEDQRATIEAEIRAARREQAAAEAQRSIYEWSKNNPNLGLEANHQILRSYLEKAGIQITVESLDLAARAVRHQLAERTPEAPEVTLTAAEKIQAENERLRSLSVAELRAEVLVEKKRKLATPEYGGYGSIFVPSFTAQEFLKMSPSQVKDLLHFPGTRHERPAVRAGIDKLLREANLRRTGF